MTVHLIDAQLLFLSVYRSPSKCATESLGAVGFFRFRPIMSNGAATVARPALQIRYHFRSTTLILRAAKMDNDEVAAFIVGRRKNITHAHTPQQPWAGPYQHR